ncbi:chemotaxis protein CheW [Sinorhizobium meliloti]|nr:chemotaxis protein CheW [Sinorhizobium meliloti]
MSVRRNSRMDAGDPHAACAPCVLGVINLRGAVLRSSIFSSARLGMKAAEPTVRHVIIVAQVKSRVVGLLVDAVSGHSHRLRRDIQPTPGHRVRFRAEFRTRRVGDRGAMICLVSSTRSSRARKGGGMSVRANMIRVRIRTNVSRAANIR